MATEKYEEIRFHAFVLAASRIDPSSISCYYLLDIMKDRERDIENRYEDDDLDMKCEKAFEAYLWIVTVACCMQTKCVKISGRWENVLWKIVELGRNRSHFQRCPPFVSKYVDTWLIRMFSNQNLCPNPFLRLEMLRFVSYLPDKYFQDATFGQKVAAGVMDTIVYLQFDAIIPDFNIHITPFRDLLEVLIRLDKYGHLDAVAAASVTKVRNLKVDKETFFFYRMTLLVSHMAEVLADKYLELSIDYLYFTEAVYDILETFRLLVFSQRTMAAYESPGLVQAAVLSIVSVTSNLVAIEPTANIANYFADLLEELDKLFLLLKESTPISRFLGLNYAPSLASINQRAAKFGFSFKHFPTSCVESTDGCPEEFVDSVTKAVMEAPVLLHSSKMVVDESTLVQMLLVTPLDPFTRAPLDHGSYSRLPDLQIDITAWRNIRRFIPVHSTGNSNIARVCESNIDDFQVIIDDVIDSDIDKITCPLQIILSIFDYI